MPDNSNKANILFTVAISSVVAGALYTAPAAGQTDDTQPESSITITEIPASSLQADDERVDTQEEAIEPDDTDGTPATEAMAHETADVEDDAIETEVTSHDDNQLDAAGGEGQSAVTLREIPEVVSRLERHDVEIVGEFESPGGLRAFAGIAQQQPIAIYLTPDQRHVIIGTMLDDNGVDMTHEPLAEASIAPWTTKTWSALENSRWVVDGDHEAPHIIYMFTDPNCPFCHKFWQQARPWVDAGKVQIRHILVGILTHTSPGKAAAILQSDNPSQALADHENAGIDGGIAPLTAIDADVADALEQNALLMEQLQIQGTPGIFYFDANKNLQVQRGAPLDADLEQILGPRD